MIGGFGKLCGDPPGKMARLSSFPGFLFTDQRSDILHSCLGLAALATMRDPDLRTIDPMLCVSVRAREAFEARKTIVESEAHFNEG